MSIDTHRAVEIEASPIRMLGFAALGLLMTALSAAIAVRAFPNVPPDSFAEFVGYAATVFFGSATLLVVWRAVTTHGPVVTITGEGIRDIRVAAEFIPWSAVSGIATWEYRRQRVMVLAVDPAAEAGLTLTRLTRWTRGANRALGADGLCVTAQGLKIGFDDLLATSLVYARAWQAGATAAPTRADPREDRGLRAP
ncbi:MAG TPA: STM3941 family protein [Xanthobacteraceae bacterium]|nr:STM3941 family protein [Xanthobacteraceae bacterium]